MDVAPPSAELESVLDSLKRIYRASLRPVEERYNYGEFY